MKANNSNGVEIANSCFGDSALRAVVGDKRSRVIELVVRKDMSDEKLDTAFKVLTGTSRDVLEDRYLSIREAQKYTTLSRITLWSHRKNGRLKYHRVGGRVVFKKSDLDRLVTG